MWEEVKFFKKKKKPTIAIFTPYFVTSKTVSFIILLGVKRP